MVVLLTAQILSKFLTACTIALSERCRGLATVILFRSQEHPRCPPEPGCVRAHIESKYSYFLMVRYIKHFRNLFRSQSSFRFLLTACSILLEINSKNNSAWLLVFSDVNHREIPAVRVCNGVVFRYVCSVTYHVAWMKWTMSRWRFYYFTSKIPSKWRPPGTSAAISAHRLEGLGCKLPPSLSLSFCYSDS